MNKPTHVKDILDFLSAYHMMQVTKSEMISTKPFGLMEQGIDRATANRRWLIIDAAQGLINEFCKVDAKFATNSSIQSEKTWIVLSELKEEFKLQQASWVKRQLCTAELKQRTKAWEAAIYLIYEIREGRGGRIYSITKSAEQQGKLFAA